MNAELQKVTEGMEILNYMAAAVFTVQHGAKIVEPSDELANKIVDFIMAGDMLNEYGYNADALVQKYLTLVVKS